MPSVNPPAKVLVSGASGFTAAWVVRTLLEQGFAVRGTVRSHEKGEYLNKAFENYGDKFELVIVPDIVKEGAFNEAVKGVDAIEYIASPFHLHADDPQEIIDPAVIGTVGILKAALEHGPSVKRIVITSSTVAVKTDLPEPKIFTADDWNEQSIQTVEKEGKAASGLQKYSASKTLAEKAAWRFYEEHKQSANWDLVVVHPPSIFGPPIHEVHDLASVNTSTAIWYHAVVARKGDSSPASAGNYIDVRDLAWAHVEALKRREAGGLRIFVTAGSFSWKQMVDSTEGKDPGTAPKGKTVYCDKIAREVLGMRYRSLEETARDTLAEIKARGW